jgi:hypothetical protein
MLFTPQNTFNQNEKRLKITGADWTILGTFQLKHEVLHENHKCSLGDSTDPPCPKGPRLSQSARMALAWLEDMVGAISQASNWSLKKETSLSHEHAQG